MFGNHIHRREDALNAVVVLGNHVGQAVKMCSTPASLQRENHSHHYEDVLHTSIVLVNHVHQATKTSSAPALRWETTSSTMKMRSVPSLPG